MENFNHASVLRADYGFITFLLLAKERSQTSTDQSNPRSRTTTFSEPPDTPRLTRVITCQGAGRLPHGWAQPTTALSRRDPKHRRDHLYFEIDAARAVCTQEWKYVAVRYNKEKIEAIKSANPEDLPRHMAYIGRLGIGVRGVRNPNFFDYDQLFHLKDDPKELKNLAKDPKHRARLKQMRGLLTENVKAMDRPFGEFLPGGDTMPPGLIDEEIALVKQLKIQRKDVIVPDGVSRNSPAAEAKKGQ